MLQIALCDDNIDELSNMVQLIDLYRTSKKSQLRIQRIFKWI